MPLIIAKATPADMCGRCGTKDLPLTYIIVPEEEQLVLCMCTICLAEAIDIATGWNQVANVVLALRRSDAAHRFKDPMSQITRARSRKRATVALRFHQPLLEVPNAEPTPAPAADPEPASPPRRPAGRRRGGASS